MPKLWPKPAGKSCSTTQIPGAREQGLDSIAARLRQQAVKGRLEPAASEAAIAALQGIDQLAAVGTADMVVEAVPERLDLKLAIFAQLGQFAKPEAILASNTSGLDIDALAAESGRPDKVIGMHFFNPPPTMPLVEIVRATETSDQTFAAVMALAQGLGKTPIAIANSPGFAVNRILFPMINEAIYALAEGVASAEDIDRVMVLGASQSHRAAGLGRLRRTRRDLGYPRIVCPAHRQRQIPPLSPAARDGRARSVGPQDGSGIFLLLVTTGHQCYTLLILLCLLATCSCSIRSAPALYGRLQRGART